MGVNLGLTPIDSFTHSAPGFNALAVNNLRKVTGLPLHSVPQDDDPVLGSSYVEALEGDDRFIRLSSVLRLIALNLARLSNDFYIYSSGLAAASPSCRFRLSLRDQPSCPAKSIRACRNSCFRLCIRQWALISWLHILLLKKTLISEVRTAGCFPIIGDFGDYRPRLQ